VIATSCETPIPFAIRLPATSPVAFRRTLRARVDQALGDGREGIEVDCATWSDLDLIMLSALVACASACGERGVRFELVNLRRELRERIEALRLDERLGLSQ
jgi:anti-anti-sigma regulatory factor